jgi:hypothetical protein
MFFLLLAVSFLLCWRMDSLRRGLLLSLFLVCFVVFGVDCVLGQPASGGEVFPLASPLCIESPSGSVYGGDDVSLCVSFKFLLGPKYVDLCYSLDGGSRVDVPLTATKEAIEVTRTYPDGTVEIRNDSIFNPYIIKGEVALPELSEGQHKITVYANYTANQIVALDEDTVWFTVTTPPETPAEVNSEVFSVNSNPETQNEVNLEFLPGLIFGFASVAVLTVVFFKKESVFFRINL